METDANQSGDPGRGEDTESSSSASTSLSYKFQRLREKLREAIVSGEFSGKLPGERQLAKRFHVNAKTLSKALTDLAAEGLLDRSIGRGTYVKGSAPAPAAVGRWLALCEPGGLDPALAAELRRHNPELTCCEDFALIRPSYLMPFSAVLDIGSGAPDAVVRDLVVRNLPLVAVGHESRTFSMHCVAPDTGMAAQKLGRDLLLAGHRRLVAVEAPGRSVLTQALRQSASRYAADAVVDTCSAREVSTLLGDGAVAFVCDSAAAAREVASAVAAHGMPDVAIVAAGVSGEADAPCTGYFVEPKAVADAVANLLRDPPARPTMIWLNGQWVDRGTQLSGDEPTSADAEKPVYQELVGAYS